MITSCPNCKAEVSDRGESWTAFKCGSVLSSNHLQIMAFCHERADRAFQAELRMKAEAEVKSLKESLSKARSEITSMKALLTDALPHLRRCEHDRRYPPCGLEKIGRPGEPYRHCTCGLGHVVETIQKTIKPEKDPSCAGG